MVMRAGIPVQALFVDVDDTLFRTQERRIEWLTRDLGDDHARLYVSNINNYEDVGTAGALRSIRDYCRQLDYNPDFYRSLPLMRDALRCLREIEGASGVRICTYLSARPFHFATLTLAELLASGFPVAPIVCRPKQVGRRQAASWKISQVLRVSWPDSIKVIIDDDPAVGLEALKRCSKEVLTIRFAEDADYFGLVAEQQQLGPYGSLDWRSIAEYLRDHRSRIVN